MPDIDSVFVDDHIVYDDLLPFAAMVGNGRRAWDEGIAGDLPPKSRTTCNVGKSYHAAIDANFAGGI